MRRFVHHQRASALLSLVLSLAIIAILITMFMGPAGPPGAPGAKPWPQQNIDRARSAVEAANLRTVNTNYMMWRMDHPGRLKPHEMQQFAQSQPSRGPGGRYFIYGDEVLSTTSFETRKFSERLGL